MGLFKSAIYFPFAVLNQLNMQEMEAIIAHELHTSKGMFLLNLIAAAIETMLYYHPVIWWLQKQLSKYREEACDDEALAFTPRNPMAYARALLKIEEMDQKNSTLNFQGLFYRKKQINYSTELKEFFKCHMHQFNSEKNWYKNLVRSSSWPAMESLCL